ncbi:hypothetical protein Metin_1242 [Methanocaldococcus infernus ME]|uniref:Uncharacterized protein n=1 Tax=Methanocaldococcus infernus (strain DSM 11812 / JCM 15783 / ME) TaxID=573063 RepID=D5VTJ1_METIM|nr:hypothetical protein [Methanocaldococcus infernus]ADG13894.1 hypothetical protein Metin_1242 [Methanocaldococcus infernus ME]
MKKNDNRGMKNFDKIEFLRRISNMNKFELHRYYKNIVKGRPLGDPSLNDIERFKASEILMKMFEPEITDIIRQKLVCSRVYFDTEIMHDYMGIDAVTDFGDRIQIKLTDKGKRKLFDVLKVSFSEREYLKILLNDYHADYYFKFIIEDAIEKPRIIAYLWCPMDYIRKNIDKFRKRKNKAGKAFYEATFRELNLTISSP